MRRLLPALLVSVACAAGVAGCGGSGSSTTTTAPVPDGRLGSTTSTSCAAKPKRSGFDVSALSATGITCDVALGIAQKELSNSRSSGWTCTQSLVGSRGTRLACTNPADESQKVNATWFAQ